MNQVTPSKKRASPLPAAATVKSTQDSSFVVAQVYNSDDGSVSQKLIPTSEFLDEHLDFMRKYEWSDENVDEESVYRALGEFIRKHKSPQLSNAAFPLQISMIYLDVWNPDVPIPARK